MTTLLYGFVAAPLLCIAPEQVVADAPSPVIDVPKQLINSIGMKLVLIPAGEFMMGSGESVDAILATFPQYERTQEWFDDEYPQHRVRITKPFYIGACEVTNSQFRKFVDATGYKTQAERTEDDPRGSGGWGFNQREQKFEGRKLEYNWKNPGFPVLDDGPVVNITWNDAAAFCKWLSETEGHTYRLPTEAEWEYAARGGATTRYWCGDEPESLARIANTADADFFKAISTYYPKSKCLSTSDGHVFPTIVGSYPPNAFGLHDIHGNVWEWTADWYGADYYAHSPIEDPTGPTSGGQKVRRGGAWHSAPLFVRLSFRNINTVVSRYPNLGFRVARNIE